MSGEGRCCEKRKRHWRIYLWLLFSRYGIVDWKQVTGHADSPVFGLASQLLDIPMELSFGPPGAGIGSERAAEPHPATAGARFRGLSIAADLARNMSALRKDIHGL